jgi:hypothetical protein
MQINLNQLFTTKDVQKLLAFKDDSQNRQLRVTNKGVAYISDEIGNINIGGLAFRVETWIFGNSYVGKEAANDPVWVSRVEAVLRNNWPTPTSDFIEDY